MKVIEILKLNEGLLNVLQRVGIRVDDVRYVDLYNDYRLLIEKGEKVSYIVAVLSSKYNVSERTVYGLLKRLQMDCNIAAL
ncbi:MAG: hypothetical protein K2G49_00570 [Muribaculum sp.]|nr:hypothetical protein [Muribaculum sp.]